MGIWIRSQDKEILTECDSVWYNTIDNPGIKLKEGNYICTDYFCLGSYSTKEKAMKVLDEIQNKILKLNYLAEPIQYDYDTVETFNCANTPKVFQMPRDDEVK